MKNLRTFLSPLLAVLIAALLALPCAAAAESPENAYIPGETAGRLIRESWDAGKMIGGDMTMRLDMDAAALGLDAEETAILEAILPVLENATLSLGAGKTEGGVRIEAGAALVHAQGGEPVSVSAAANLDLYGISVESDLIPGQRVTSRWETLLAMAGMGDDDINMLLMLRDTDWAATLPQIAEMAQAYLQMGLEYAQPYGGIIANWAAALPMTLEEGPAPEGCPEDAAVSSVIVTEQDLMTLAAALAEYLKSDAVVCGLCDLLIQEAYTGEGEAPTTVQICDEIIAYAANVTNTDDYVKLTWGVRVSGEPDRGETQVYSAAPVYGAIQLFSVAEGTITLAASCVPSADAHMDYAVDFDIVSADGASLLCFACSGEAADGLFTAHAEMAESGAQIMGLEYSLTTTATTDTLPGQKMEQTISMAISDGETSMQMLGTTTANAVLTADGGEVLDETTNTDMYVDGVQTITTSLETLAVYPDADGFTGSYSTLQNMPAYGVDAIGFDVHLSDHAYDPASTQALHETAFETSSRAVIDALLATLSENCQLRLNAVMQALPANTLNLLLDM